MADRPCLRGASDHLRMAPRTVHVRRSDHGDACSRGPRGIRRHGQDRRAGACTRRDPATSLRGRGRVDSRRAGAGSPGGTCASLQRRALPGGARSRSGLRHPGRRQRYPASAGRHHRHQRARDLAAGNYDSPRARERPAPRRPLGRAGRARIAAPSAVGHGHHLRHRRNPPGALARVWSSGPARDSSTWILRRLAVHNERRSSHGFDWGGGCCSSRDPGAGCRRRSIRFCLP